MSAAGVNAAAKAAARAAAAPAKATAQAGAASASASSASSTAKLLAPAPDTVPMKYSWETGNYVAAVPIQSESELHPLKRFNVKKFRLHPSFRLRKVRKWRDFAPYITKLALKYDPTLVGTSGIQELRRQCRGDKIMAEFPKYEVDLKEIWDGQPATVTVTWTTGKVQVINAQHAVLLDIFDQMAGTAQQLQWEEEDKEML